MPPLDSATEYCEVALPRPLLQTFSYRLPAEMAGRARPGCRVMVPFRRGRAVGCITALSDECAIGSVKSVGALLDEEPLLSDRLLRLCRWAADYYVAPIGLLLRAALPPGLLTASADGATSKAAPRLERQVIRLTRELPTLTARREAFGRAHRQREAYETLESLGGSSTAAHLTTGLGFSRAVLKGLVEKGLARLEVEAVRRDPWAGMEAAIAAAGNGSPAPPRADDPGPGARLQPTPAQARAIAELRAQAALPDPGVTLLRGVTGSGKTLVYLDLLEEVVERSGRSAILLIPEISLTPQTVGRFRARFGDRVAILHSGLSPGERFDEWEAIRRGVKPVVIGARSAVFAPVVDLGAIILDEEHEGSYKQSETPRYHARAVAAMRARLEGCLCLLGSATPSLESWKNATDGRYRLLELGERVTGQPLPTVELIDLRGAREAARRGEEASEASASEEAAPGPLVLSEPLRAAVAERLARGEQVILLLNRRGYATFVQCLECGKVWSCTRCSVSLTYHRRRRRLLCHHCGFEAELPARCDECGAPGPTCSGLGTEQVERRLGELFPAASVARMDMDTTGTKWAHFKILERVRRGEIDILLGTQMIAKGLDFPGVTLVGVVNADVSLNLPDFRASERTFQLLSQVAGRAGRGSEPGRVLVQTSYPEHFALEAAAAHDYAAFAQRELADRLEPGYPPHRKLANLVLSGSHEGRVADAAVELARWTRELIADRRLEGVEVVGPAPCPIDRLRGRWRWHFLLKADAASTLGPLLRYLGERRARGIGGARLEIDRDPEALL